MATSNFQQFNPTQANQDSDAQYTIDTLRTGGAATNGICPSVSFNKLAYQLSTFVAALGQSLANKGYTVSDVSLANLTTVLANLITKADLGASITTVGYATAVSFNAATISPILGVFELTLTGNVSSSALSNFTPGQVIIFIVVQDGVGGRTFAWPPQVTGGLPIGSAPNAKTVQAFIVTEESAVVPLVPTPSYITTQNTPTRNLDTAYQNTGSTPRFVNVVAGCPSGAYAAAKTDSSPTPSTVVAVVGTVSPSVGGSYTLSFVVLPGNYYVVATQAGGPYVQEWVEWQ